MKIKKRRRPLPLQESRQIWRHHPLRFWMSSGQPPGSSSATPSSSASSECSLSGPCHTRQGRPVAASHNSDNLNGDTVSNYNIIQFDQGSISRNLISAENFSHQFLTFNFGQFFIQNSRHTYVYLITYFWTKLLGFMAFNGHLNQNKITFDHFIF
jgi:hypothetical protein